MHLRNARADAEGGSDAHRGKVDNEHALHIAEINPVGTISGVGYAASGTLDGTFGAIEFYKGDDAAKVILSALDASTHSQDKVTVLVKPAAEGP